MESKTYKQEFRVRYSEVNSRQEATITSILDCLEEVAINHSESVGYGVKNLMALSLGWVLNRWNLKVERYPGLDEKIVVETWPSSFDRFYATREFRVWDAEGKLICRASSLWLLINLEKRRPIRVPENIAAAYSVNPERVMENEPLELKPLEAWTEEREFDVRRGDIDTNGHVNNVVYVQWLIEGIPQEVYENYSLSELEVVYKKETSYGRKVSVCLEEAGGVPDENCLEYLHLIEHREEKTTLLSGRSLWEKRKVSNNIK